MDWKYEFGRMVAACGLRAKVKGVKDFKVALLYDGSADMGNLTGRDYEELCAKFGISFLVLGNYRSNFMKRQESGR